MVPGSVIVDVSIDQGGNCAPTLAGEVSVYDQVTLVGVHASRLYADNVLHYVSNLFKDGRIRWDDDIVRNTLVTHEGRALHAGASRAGHGACRGALMNSSTRRLTPQKTRSFLPRAQGTPRANPL